MRLIHPKKEEIIALHKKGFGGKLIARFLSLKPHVVLHQIKILNLKPHIGSKMGGKAMALKSPWKKSIKPKKKQLKLSDLPLFSFLVKDPEEVRKEINKKKTIWQMERYRNDPIYRKRILEKKARYMEKPESRIKTRSYARKYNKNNRHKIREMRRIPINRVKNNLRSRIREMIHGDLSSTQSIGCNRLQLKVHLENQFRDGMSWDNYGSVWHVDHIIPLASASTPEQAFILNHYSNLQPLFAEENMKKGCRVAPPKVLLANFFSRVDGTPRHLARYEIKIYCFTLL